MMTYLSNVFSWLRGFGKLGEISYKPGWSPTKFLLLYLIDYGFCTVFMAGPVTSVSRYTQDHWFSTYHGAHSGPDLWGTVRCRPIVRVIVPLCWLGLLVWGYVK